jgi:hypothetical protein
LNPSSGTSTQGVLLPSKPSSATSLTILSILEFLLTTSYSLSLTLKLYTVSSPIKSSRNNLSLVELGVSLPIPMPTGKLFLLSLMGKSLLNGSELISIFGHYAFFKFS